MTVKHGPFMLRVCPLPFDRIVGPRIHGVTGILDHAKFAIRYRLSETSGENEFAVGTFSYAKAVRMAWEIEQILAEAVRTDEDGEAATLDAGGECTKEAGEPAQ